jgi:hypothetical protein
MIEVLARGTRKAEPTLVIALEQDLLAVAGAHHAMAEIINAVYAK